MNWDKQWEEHKRKNPVGCAAMCNTCGGSSISDCMCAKQRWIQDRQREEDFMSSMSNPSFRQLVFPAVGTHQCFWCKDHVDSVASIILISKARNLCKHCINKLM